MAFASSIGIWKKNDLKRFCADESEKDKKQKIVIKQEYFIYYVMATTKIKKFNNLFFEYKLKTYFLNWKKYRI